MVNQPVILRDNQLILGKQAFSALVKQHSNILDVLDTYTTIETIPLGHLLESLPTLKPRHFSLATDVMLHGEDKKCKIAFNIEQHLLPNGKMFNGLCSTYLGTKQVNEKIYIAPSKSTGFSIPQDNDIPLILIATGTGITPYMAFIERKISTGGEVHLFYGSRHPESYFLYFSLL